MGAKRKWNQTHNFLTRSLFFPLSHSNPTEGNKTTAVQLRVTMLHLNNLWDYLIWTKGNQSRDFGSNKSSHKSQSNCEGEEVMTWACYSGTGSGSVGVNEPICSIILKLGPNWVINRAMVPNSSKSTTECLKRHKIKRAVRSRPQLSLLVSFLVNVKYLLSETWG